VFGVAGHCAAGVGVPPGTFAAGVIDAYGGAIEVFWATFACTRIIAHRERNIGVVAACRKLVTNVYYGLRDGELGALAEGAA
jgi:hypothetical protein